MSKGPKLNLATFPSVIFELNLNGMSQPEESEFGYGTARSEQREHLQRGSEADQQWQTERASGIEPSTKHDVDYYIRKVNRYEAEIAQLEDELSSARMKLSRVQDVHIKYDLLFHDHQDTLALAEALREETGRLRKVENVLNAESQKLRSEIKLIRLSAETEKKTVQEVRQQREQLKSQSSSQASQEKQMLKQKYLRELDQLKKEFKEREESFEREISELKSNLATQQLTQCGVQFQINSLKTQKQNETTRLQLIINTLKENLSEENKRRENEVTQNRERVVDDTKNEKEASNKVSEEIESTLLEQLRNVYGTLVKKNGEIDFLIGCDKSGMKAQEQTERSLRMHIRRLEEKIFKIQRENQLQLFNTINRLKQQYEKNLAEVNSSFESVRETHTRETNILKKSIGDLQKEILIMGKQQSSLEYQNKQLAQQKEQSVALLSQQMISLESAKDTDLKNYTTSMKQIEVDAKAKMDDLHISIANKEGEVEILTEQLVIKNSQINHLLEEISNLRSLNREKLSKLSSTNSREQDNLNTEINAMKKTILELRAHIISLESSITDQEAQFKLEAQRAGQELLLAKQNNELLKGRNNLLGGWCKELQRDLKAERVSNVNILHDQNTSKRENVQTREEVRVEVQAIRDKEMEQLRNIHRLEKGRLEGELGKKEYELREKKDELARLMVQFKNLESKVGKANKVDRSAEDEAKCKATLKCEILLTENIFNAINVNSVAAK